MDNEILLALNNLSFSLEEMSKIIQENSTNQSKMAESMSSGVDINRNILTLQNSINQIVSINKDFVNEQKEFLQVFRNQSMITDQPRFETLAPQEISTEKVKIQSNSIEANVKEITIPTRLEQINELPKFNPIRIPLEFSEIPNLNIKNLNSLKIPIEYGDFPMMPSLENLETQMIPLDYSKPEMPVLDKFETINIPLMYELPKLPDLGKIQNQKVEIDYNISPLPKLNNIQDQQVNINYGKLPELPTLAKLTDQTINLKYGELPKSPDLSKIVDQTIKINYGELPDITGKMNLEKQEIPLQYSKLPKLPDLVQLDKQTIPIEYGKFPTIDKQTIPIEYGKFPTIDKLPKPNPIEVPINFTSGLEKNFESSIGFKNYAESISSVVDKLQSSTTNLSELSVNISESIGSISTKFNDLNNISFDNDSLTNVVSSLQQISDLSVNDGFVETISQVTEFLGNFMESVSNLDLVANEKFESLSNNISKVGNSLNQLNTSFDFEKMNTINPISGPSMMMPSMDNKQFNSIMSGIEKNSNLVSENISKNSTPSVETKEAIVNIKSAEPKENMQSSPMGDTNNIMASIDQKLGMMIMALNNISSWVNETRTSDVSLRPYKRS